MTSVSTTVVSSDPLLGGPGGITVGRGGKLLASDFNGGSYAILKVNPKNGNVATVSDSGKLQAPFDLAQARNGQIYGGDVGVPTEERRSSGSIRTPGRRK